MPNLDKIAILKQENTPYYKPISNTKIGFYNTDSNTAKMHFIIHKDGFPYQLGPVNVTGYLWLKSSNGSMSGQLDLEIIDSQSGVVAATVPNEFLKAATNTECKGQILLAVNGNTDIATLGEFSFRVDDALPNQIKGDIKVKYFRMFDDMKNALEQKVSDIKQAVDNLEDYVIRVQDASFIAIQKLETIKNEAVSSIDRLSASASSELKNLLEQYKKSAIETKESAVSNIQSKADESSQVLDNKKNESISYIDEKIQQFNTAYENNGFATPDDVDSKINALQWQKYKITNDDGTLNNITGFDFNNPEQFLNNGGSAYVAQVINQPLNASQYGFVHWYKRSVQNTSHEKLYYTPYNTNEVYLRTKISGVWKDWEKISHNQTDTGWIEFFLINGATSNTAFANEGDGGFKCAYRKEVKGNLTTNYLRINGSNLTQGQVLVMLPPTFTKHAQSFPIRVPTSQTHFGGYITIRPSGEVKFYINGDPSQWNSSGYVYGEFSWID
ncbi:BppU family phage baseplate upper protein [Staphylococcus simulans]|uniref:BppU family phage baseplate upper protein n=1 Tax=Staphylococcus simulans TaxID=1286 RepID=UPI0027EB2BEA|nr:BppU family phage baseplate upper protein [Staphylococcus simulans]MDQ7113894.1 BppU family phage baseplate upper protein [Staphylococcus simulans]MDQ7117695.1 BppU family phage baseplate upper protein [Staphylococcus simulans]